MANKHEIITFTRQDVKDMLEILNQTPRYRDKHTASMRFSDTYKLCSFLSEKLKEKESENE